MSNNTNSKYTHTEIIELLPLYVNNSLDDKGRERVDSHLEHCEECRQELAFEQQIQQAASVKVDVSQIAQRNLAKFNSRLDDQQSMAREAELTTNSVVPSVSCESGTSGLLERFGRFLQTLVPVPGRQLGGAMAMGLCAVVVLGVMYQSSRDDGLTGFQDPGYIVRGCEASDQVQQYEFKISPVDSTPVNVESVELLLDGAFPDSNYHMTASENELLVTVDGTVCDKRIPKLTRSLEEQQSIGSVKVRSLLSN